MTAADRPLRRSRRKWLADCTGAVAFAAGAWAVPASGTRAADGTEGAGAGARAAGRPAKVLVLGDSLSAEYGIARGSGWVALLQQRLAGRVPAVAIVNASISGDTTAGGRTRLPPLLERERPTVVVVELGANDALRGLPLGVTRENLIAMTRAARAAGARTLLAGMQLPPNYGRRYGTEFATMYAEVAKAESAALVPFFLHGVADVPDAESRFQPDRIHPLASAHPTILGNIWPVLEPMLRR